MAIPTLVAAIHTRGTSRRRANHCAAPITAPAIRPPARAGPTESTGPTTTFAISPPIGKPRRAVSGHAQMCGRGVAAVDAVCDTEAMDSFLLRAGEVRGAVCCRATRPVLGPRPLVAWEPAR